MKRKEKAGKVTAKKISRDITKKDISKTLSLPAVKMKLSSTFPLFPGGNIKMKGTPAAWRSFYYYFCLSSPSAIRENLKWLRKEIWDTYCVACKREKKWNKHDNIRWLPRILKIQAAITYALLKYINDNKIKKQFPSLSKINIDDPTSVSARFLQTTFGELIDYYKLKRLYNGKDLESDRFKPDYVQRGDYLLKTEDKTKLVEYLNENLSLLNAIKAGYIARAGNDSILNFLYHSSYALLDTPRSKVTGEVLSGYEEDVDEIEALQKVIREVFRDKVTLKPFLPIAS